MKLKLRRIHAVLAVQKTGSASAAATLVHMTQPAVTAAVAALESDLGVALFDRTNKGMLANETGRLFCVRGQAAIKYLKTAEAMIRARHSRTTQSPAPSLHRLISEVQLRALIAVVETGGFSSAARRLGLTQPTLYRAAKDLAELCGLALWETRGAIVTPTTEALELARLGRLCFAALNSACDELREYQGVMDGQLNIGALPLARSQWLPDALALILERHPKARVRIVDGPYSEQLNALRHARIDMILGALRKPAPTEDVHQIPVFDDPQVILVRAGHPLALGFDSETDKLSPEQLDGLSWILPPVETPGRKVFDAFMVDKGLQAPKRVVECSSLVATRALLARSDHAAVLSRRQVEPEVASGALKVMGPPLSGSLRAIGITIRGDFKPTRLQAECLELLLSGPGASHYA
jgi:DNA-binding transcriptional LysR family regulator